MSNYKATCYERMAKQTAERQAEVARWLSAAEAVDVEEDQAFGRDKSSQEMPDWIADGKPRELRLASRTN